MTVTERDREIINLKKDEREKKYGIKREKEERMIANRGGVVRQRKRTALPGHPVSHSTFRKRIYIYIYGIAIRWRLEGSRGRSLPRRVTFSAGFRERDRAVGDPRWKLSRVLEKKMKKNLSSTSRPSCYSTLTAVHSQRARRVRAYLTRSLRRF